MLRTPLKQIWAVCLCAALLGILSTATATAQTTTAIVAVNSGLCVSVAAASTANSALVVQSSCTGQPDETWSLVTVGSAYHVISQNSGLCLNVPGASKTSGTQLIQWTCQSSASTNDQWKLTAVSTGYELVSVSSGFCVSIASSSDASGAAVLQSTCSNGATNQQFYVQTASSSAQTLPSSTDIVSANSGQCLNGTTASNPVTQAICDGQSDNTWTVYPVGSNYHLIDQSTGLCLNVPGNSSTAGTQLIQWACQSASQLNDQWQLVPVGSSYHLVSASNGLCVNISGSSQTPGAAVLQEPCQTATVLNDQFFLYSPSSVAATLPSVWTPVVSLPVTPMGVANLPNGTLLMWSAYAPYTYEGDIGAAAGQTYTGIFNPATETSTDVLVTSTGADLFCPGTAVLPNGQVLINGGSSSPKTSLYNPLTNVWSIGAEMNIPRGYEGDTLLSTGNVFTLGGSWSGGQGGKSGEVWNSTSGWTVLSGVPETNIIGPDPKGVYRGDNHLWMFAASNGAVFQAGPSALMNWITTSGAGTITSAGNRGNDPFSVNGNAVLYDIGKILKVGGASAYDQDQSTPTYASNSAYLINISGGPSQPVQLQQLQSMTYQRSFANSVVLPNGEVVVIGGQSIPQPFTDTDAVLVPEIWNPTTQTFSFLTPMQVPRTYHSTAILLADGRVFSGGGGQCGVGCPNNHLDAQILTPPYLLNANGSAATRPIITSAPTSATLGGTLAVTTQAAVSSFALMRLSATTHTVNNDQRRVPLSVKSVSGTKYTLAIPSDPGVVLPGYYMLFALNAQGVPSVSTTVLIP